MPGLDEVQIHLVDSTTEAARFMRWLGETRDVIGFDTETTGLDKFKDRIRLAQFGDAHTGWAIPFERWGGVVVEALGRYDGQIVMHNAKYDTALIERELGHKLDRSRIHDTMMMSRVIDATQSAALKSLTARFIDRKAAAAQSMLDDAMTANKWTWATVPLDFHWYWFYGGLDPVLTVRIMKHFGPLLDAGPRRAYELEMAALWVALEMEKKGARIDRDFTAQTLEAFRANTAAVADWTQANYGLTPGADIKIISQLQKDGCVLTKTTKSGSRLALDAEVLEAFPSHPLAAAVLQYRRTGKLAGTYLENFLELADDEGVLHPNINTCQARTSRMSVDTPALQTLPRKSEDNPLAIAVRNCFIPRDGNVLVLCDFDQIEARMFAHLCEDPAMRAAFAEGDFFTNMAREIYGDLSIIKADPRRQLTKNAIYAIAYGSGLAKFCLTAGISEEQGRPFWDALHAKFPGIKRFQRAVGNVAMQRKASEGQPYVISPLTGRRHVADDGKEYALVNYLIQGSAAEVLKMKLVELDAAGLGEFMILPVHDEVIFDVPAADAVEVAQLVKATMEETSLFAVPLTAGVDTASRWGMKGS
jgi:DNA polymerase-1